MDSLMSQTLNTDIFKPRDLFINRADGVIEYSFFVTSLGKNLVTSDGDYFKVRI
jgi:hypothetical protein